jgi:tRNA 2-thiouridine synthesizing protein A
MPKTAPNDQLQPIRSNSLPLVSILRCAALDDSDRSAMAPPNASPAETGASMSDADAELDVSGYQCPLPVLKASKRLSAMEPGSVLRLIATDPAAAIDVPHFCNEQRHQLITSSSENGRLIFLIRKGA